jgi:hypothetical protein
MKSVLTVDVNKANMFNDRNLVIEVQLLSIIKLAVQLESVLLFYLVMLPPAIFFPLLKNNS